MRPPTTAADDADRQAVVRLLAVSHETERRLALYVERLGAWRRIKNLVAPSTLGHVWRRHIADSAQLVSLAPEARVWADLGSGAGFPGLVVAILLHGRDDAMVHLIEANGRKCAFLREVVRLTGAPATVHAGRIEDVLPSLGNLDVVTSRALAPWPVLCTLARSSLDCGATGLFLTGEGGADVVGDSVGVDRVEAIPSLTQTGASILRVTRREGAAKTGEEPR